MQKCAISVQAEKRRWSLFTAIGEIFLTCIALLLTITDITVRGVYYLLVKSFHLLVQLCVIALIAGFFLLAYLLIAGFHQLSGSGFNAN